MDVQKLNEEEHIPIIYIEKTYIWNNFSRENFYQVLIEKWVHGKHKNLICGRTDISTHNRHAEIKEWRLWKSGMGQL